MDMIFGGLSEDEEEAGVEAEAGAACGARPSSPGPSTPRGQVSLTQSSPTGLGGAAASGAASGPEDGGMGSGTSRWQYIPEWPAPPARRSELDRAALLVGCRPGFGFGLGLGLGLRLGLGLGLRLGLGLAHPSPFTP